MKNIFKKLFNLNTGYFINEVSYFYEGRTYIGYVLCKGYVLFGIPGYDKIDCFVDKSDAYGHLEVYNAANGF